jgi:hypothetical protein
MEASDNNIILTDTAADKPFVAFGDESLAADRDSVAYAYVWFLRGKTDLIESRIRRVKKRFKVPEHIRLHCSQFMAPDQRTKLGIGFLTTPQVRDMLKRVVTVINDSHVSIIYGQCSMQDAKLALGSEISFCGPAEDTHALPINHSAKSLQGFLSNCCKVHLPQNLCQIFNAAEYSMTPQLIGRGKQQAHNTNPMFSDIGAPAAQWYEVQHTVAEANYHVGFELADVVAYLSVNAFVKAQPHAYYKEQLQRIHNLRGGPMFVGGTRVPSA